MAENKRRRSAIERVSALVNRRKAIAALLANPTIAAAAAACGIGESTLRKWMKLPKFATAYQQRQEEVLDRVVTAMASATVDALAALKRNLTCGQPGPEVRAATAIVELTIKGREHLLALGELASLREQVQALLEQQKEAAK